MALILALSKNCEKRGRQGRGDGIKKRYKKRHGQRETKTAANKQQIQGTNNRRKKMVNLPPLRTKETQLRHAAEYAPNTWKGRHGYAQWPQRWEGGSEGARKLQPQVGRRSGTRTSDSRTGKHGKKTKPHVPKPVHLLRYSSARLLHIEKSLACASAPKTASRPGKSQEDLGAGEFLCSPCSSLGRRRTWSSPVPPTHEQPTRTLGDAETRAFYMRRVRGGGGRSKSKSLGRARHKGTGELAEAS